MRAYPKFSAFVLAARNKSRSENFAKFGLSGRAKTKRNLGGPGAKLWSTAMNTLLYSDVRPLRNQGMPGVTHFLAPWPRPASFLRAGELMSTPLGVITPSPLGAITPPPGHSTKVAITPPITHTTHCPTNHTTSHCSVYLSHCCVAGSASGRYEPVRRKCNPKGVLLPF